MIPVRIIDKHIGRSILGQTAIVFAVLVGLFEFLTFMDQLNDLGVGRYDIWEICKYVALVIPRLAYEMFPVATLLGTILGLSILAADSELIVMRASGFSLGQIVLSVFKTGALLVLVAVTIGELVLPTTETVAQKGRAEALRGSIQKHSGQGLWLRDGQSFVNIQEMLPDLSLLGIKIFEFDDKHHLRALAYSQRAKFVDGTWQLQDVAQTFIEKPGTGAKTVKTANWLTGITPQILSVFVINPDQLSAVQLKRYIDHLRENNQETQTYELSFWHKIIMPFSTAVMVLIAIPFVFSQIRTGGLGRNLFGGVLLGMTFYLANKGVGYMVLVRGTPPFIGALITPTLFLLGAMLLMRRMH